MFPVQALVGKTLEEASVKKDGVLSELYKAMEYGEELIHAENNEVDEMANTREGRQKSILLEKASIILHRVLVEY